MKINDQIIRSVIETDLYKLTMQQSVLFQKHVGVSYQDIDVEYSFINRNKTLFTDNMIDEVRNQINLMSNLQLTESEYNFLTRKCPYFKRSYLDFLKGYRFNPDEVKLEQYNGNLSISIKGPWYKTILWEVPILAIVSEVYYRLNDLNPIEGWINVCKNKAKTIFNTNIKVADFGTRRRFSYDVHKKVVEILSEVQPNFVGSSNVHLCHQYNLTPIGSVAHEWYQAHSALFGYNNANYYAMEAWVNQYDGSLGHALTDTFTTDVFLNQFNLKFAKLFDGVRQDSGDPHVFTEKVVKKYESMGIDPSSKTIIFSDSLNLEKANCLASFCDMKKIKCSFGVGTFLTNDVGHKPLNIVIKMTKCNNVDTIKLSDDPGKISGNPSAIDLCKKTLGI